MFPFPSNGKVLSDIETESAATEREIVSIPFQRESPFGLVKPYVKPLNYRFQFQFPSNGKAFSDLREFSDKRLQ